MTKKQKTILRGDMINDPALPAAFSVSSPYWQEWLEENRTFRYESGNGDYSFTAVKDSRGYWSAQRRVDGHLRQKRLGKSEALAQKSASELYDVAAELGEISYWENKASGSPKALKTEIARLNQKLHNKDQELYTQRRGYEDKLSELQTELESYKVSQNNSEESYKVSQNVPVEEIKQILTSALEMKANRGGAIKAEIRKALEKL